MSCHWLKRVAFLLAFAGAGAAHVGNTDVYLDGDAGPYRLFVTIRPPAVIPGIAEIAVRSETSGVDEIRAVPVPLSGEGAKFAPVADKLQASAQDPQFFTGSLWMMVAGSWQVRLTVRGNQGGGTLSVPVPVAALSTKPMQTGLAALLALLLVFLTTGMVAIVGAGFRESRLPPGLSSDAQLFRRARKAMAVALTIILGIVALGGKWWTTTAATYQQKIYKPLQMEAVFAPGNILTLRVTDPGWFQSSDGRIGDALFTRRLDDLVLDHRHLMHLYAIREPGLDVVYHLHPDLIETGVFRLTLPTMPHGRYKLYADVVHETGFPETLVASVDLPAVQGRALAGDDAEGIGSAWKPGAAETNFALPDGYRMEWLRDSASLHAKEPEIFRFRLLDQQGRPAHIALYMGMLGHAAFVKTDGTAFAHVHPSGSVSMAALMLAQKESTSGVILQNTAMQSSGQTSGMEDMAMPMMQTVPNEVGFPYGFPSPGSYRIFVQIKHDNTIEAAMFDAEVK